VGLVFHHLKVLHEVSDHYGQQVSEGFDIGNAAKQQRV